MHFFLTPEEVWNCCLVACKFISPGRLAPSDAEWLLEGIVEYLKPCLYLFACKGFFFSFCDFVLVTEMTDLFHCDAK